MTKLVDLEPDDCRWPSGGWPTNEPITFDCKHKQIEGLSYCREHFLASTGRGTTSERLANHIGYRNCEPGGVT